jgi:hypothetical protein
VTDLERVVTDTADPSPQTPRPQKYVSPKRPRWKNAVGAAAVAVVLATIGVGGYFGVNAALSHPSSETKAPPTLGIGDPVKDLPPGAAACDRIATDILVPFNAGARGTPATSCAFVEQVRKEYSAHSTPASGPSQLSAVSPATSKWYQLACLSTGTYVTCTGGAAAVIYLYNR